MGNTTQQKATSWLRFIVLALILALLCPAGVLAEDSSLTLSVQTAGSQVTLQGTTVSASWVTVLVTKSSNGDKAYIDQIKSDNAGNYQVIFRLDNGDYQAKVSSSRKQQQTSFKVDSQVTLLTPPVLSADSTDNILGQALDLSFPDDPAWRNAISGLTADGTVLAAGRYTITAGNLHLLAGALTTTGSHVLTVTATGYNDATVTQTIAESNQDQARADQVSALIDALPAADQITLANQAQIEAARASYTALSEAQKALVTNLAKLTAAEAALAQLQGGDLVYQTASLDSGKRVATLTFNTEIVNNQASLEQLKSAVTYAVDGVNYTALQAADQVSIAGKNLAVIFNTPLTGSGNKLRVAANTLKNTAGKVLSREITTEALDAGKLDECFIATAAYGSKYQPDVVLLRQFRDHCLLTNPLGQEFVKFYYKHSPPIANFIAHSEGLKVAVRGMLAPLVVLAYLLLHPGAMAGVLAAVALGVAGLRRRKRNRVEAAGLAGK